MKRDIPHLSRQGDAPVGGFALSDWAVPWSDIMMCLCVVFVVLFVYARTQKDVRILFKPEADPAVSVRQVEPLDNLIARFAAHKALMQAKAVDGEAHEMLYRSENEGVTVVRDRDGSMRVTLRGELFFDPAQAGLKPSAADWLAEVAEVLKVNQNPVQVTGFADQDEVAEAASFGLSAQRAVNVVEHLVLRHGLLPTRFQAAGRGVYQPESPGVFPGHAERNRRVEIILIALK